MLGLSGRDPKIYLIPVNSTLAYSCGPETRNVNFRSRLKVLLREQEHQHNKPFFIILRSFKFLPAVSCWPPSKPYFYHSGLHPLAYPRVSYSTLPLTHISKIPGSIFMSVVCCPYLILLLCKVFFPGLPGPLLFFSPPPSILEGPCSLLLSSRKTLCTQDRCLSTQNIFSSP